jgi:UDP-N-acetylglucosamine 2-epimerase (non-hydrolysing)
LNLQSEGHSHSTFVTGNTVVDAIKRTEKRIFEGSLSVSSWIREIVENSSEPIILATQHRRENFGEPLKNVLRALNYLSNEGARVLFPVHPNPNVKLLVESFLNNNERIHLIPPLTYSDLVYLLSQSRLVITDSGGLQEEGPTLGVPVIVTRDKTERPEGVASGAVLLVGTDFDKIVKSAMNILFDDQTHNEMSMANNPYGDGTSARQIIDLIQSYLAQ